jgi:hypothetical protein
MFNAGIPQTYWPDIFESVTFVINTLPTSSTSFKTPYHTLFNKIFDYSFFKVLGCRCFPYTRPYAVNKLAPHSSSCAFLGYSSTFKGYKCLHLETNKIFLSRHVIFDENSFPFKEYKSPPPSTSVSSSLSSLVVIQPTDHYPHSSPSITTLSDSLSSPTTPFVPHQPLPLPTNDSSLPPMFPPITRVYERKQTLHEPTRVPASVPLHHMITRSRTKQVSTPHKALLATCHNASDVALDPTCYTQASKQKQ